MSHQSPARSSIRNRLQRPRRLLIMVVVFCIVLTPNAFAYLDAGTGSLIIQLGIGAFLGLLLTAKLWWMKLKMLLGQVFGGSKKDIGSDQ